MRTQRLEGSVRQVRNYVVADSTPDQVENLFRRLLAGVAPPAPVPAPVPEVLLVEKLLQRLLGETQIRQPAPVASEPAGLETLLRLLLSGQQPAPMAEWSKA